MDKMRGVIEAVMAWAEAGLDRPLSVDAMARRAGYSTAYFSRAFAAVVGDTPANWLAGRRVARAMERLSGTEEHLLDISLACGFQDRTTFGRVFRRQTGRSPSQFRREQAAIADGLRVRTGDRLRCGAFRLCGLSADVADDPSIPGRLWARLSEDLRHCGRTPAAGQLRQVAFWREQPWRLYTCVAGFLIDADEGLPPPFVTLTVPATVCRSFIVDGGPAGLAEAYREVFEQRLPATGDRQTHDFVVECPRRDGGEGVEIRVPVED